MKVDSEEFLLAIPDFAQTARGEFESTTPAENRSVLSSSSSESAALFKKVIMKLSGRVRWVVGLMFEREISADGSDCAAGKTRSFELKPHYEVTLKNPSSAKAPPGQVSLPESISRPTLTKTRFMMLSEDSGVTTFTSRSLLCHPLIEIGRHPARSHRLATIPFTSLQGSSPISSRGGDCSQGLCLFPYDKVVCGPAQRNPIRNSVGT